MSETQPQSISKTELIVVPDAIKPITAQVIERPTVVHAGVRVSIPEGAFKGDPRRVLGHPSNPGSRIFFNDKE